MNISNLKQSAAWVLQRVGLLLLIPLIAMQLTSEVQWGAEDFVAAGLLLFLAGMAYVVLARLARSHVRRVFASVAILTVLALVWAELAVGVFG